MFKENRMSQIFITVSSQLKQTYFRVSFFPLSLFMQNWIELNGQKMAWQFFCKYVFADKTNKDQLYNLAKCSVMLACLLFVSVVNFIFAKKTFLVWKWWCLYQSIVDSVHFIIIYWTTKDVKTEVFRNWSCACYRNSILNGMKNK